jgi:uncharacterized protein with FMN-binding domain
VAAIVATALGLILLFSFKTPDTNPQSGPPDNAAFGTATAPATTAPALVGTSRPGATANASTPIPTSAASTGGDQRVDGDVIGTRFGDVQVRVMESGGKIVDVKAIQLPFDRRRSLEISQFAEPILHSETLAAQSAQIDTVSGATYTSDAYRTSLQSALDRVHG